MKYLRLYGHIAIILSCCFECLGQQNYSIVHYTGDNGLPQNSIKSIAVDAYGFIWLATEDGLVRFDGGQFYVYNRHNLGISDNRVLSIHTTKRARYHPDRARNQTCIVHFTNHNVAIKIENGIAVRDTLYDWAWKKKTQSLYHEPGRLIEARDIPDNVGINFPFQRYMVAAGDQDGNFYICDKVHIKYYEHWKMAYQMPFVSNNLWQFFSIGETLFYFDKSGAAIFKISNGKAQRKPISGDILMDPSFARHKRDIRLYWNHNSEQAFLALHDNLYFLQQDKEGNLNTRALIMDFDLNSTEIMQVHYDKATEKVYLGSGTQGLYILTKKQFRAITPNNLYHNNIFYAQLPYNDYSIIAPRGDLIGINPSTGKAYYRTSIAFSKKYAHDERLMSRDNCGNIWAKIDNGIMQMDSLAIKILRIVRFEKEISAMCQGEDKWLWFALKSSGVYRIDTSNPLSTAELVVKDIDLAITTLQYQGRKGLLIGTTTGLYSFDFVEKELKLIYGTNNVHIASIHKSDQGGFWITALEKGVMLLTEAGNIINFPLDRERYLASAHCAVDDGNGYLWITTNRGLFQMAIYDLMQYAHFKIAAIRGKVEPSASLDLFYAYHTLDEGFYTNEFNGSCMPCAAKLANGDISLPSIKGLVWFKPELINNYQSNDSIVIEDVQVNRKPITINHDSLLMPAGSKNIRVKFATAYFGNNYNLNISYALIKVGTDLNPSGWTPVDNKDMSIRYSGLESGQYVLSIKKVTGFGLNNAQIKRIHISILPFWYETILAKLIFLAIFVFVLGLMVSYYSKYRLRSITKENTRLEELVSVKTADLFVTLSQLEKSKSEMSSQIHIMSRILASITHDVQSPLKYIAFSSRGISDMIKKEMLDDASRVGIAISDMSIRMSTLLGDLLNYVKVQVYQKRLHLQTIHLHDLISSKAILFGQVIEQNGNMLINDVPATLEVYSDNLLLSIIIHNLLDNASKYTHNGTIRIYSNIVDDQRTEVIIANNGSSISDELLNIINSTDNDLYVGNQLDKQRAAGLGLLIVKEIATLLDIGIYVNQRNETSFHLVFDSSAMALRETT